MIRHARGPEAGSTRRKRPTLFLLITVSVFLSVCTRHMWAGMEKNHLQSTKEILVAQSVINPCPAGHKVEFQFGQTSLFVDLNWVGLGTVIQIQNRFDGKCPTIPIHEIDLVFDQTNLGGDVLDMFVQEGLPGYLEIKPNKGKAESYSLPTNASTRREYPGGAIEDVTSVMPTGDNGWMRKRYRIEPKVGPDKYAPAYLMGCAGTPGKHIPGRRCGTVGRQDGDLSVNYQFRQDRYGRKGQRWLTPDGTISEPEGFLDMDARVRHFVDDLRRKTKTRD